MCVFNYTTNQSEKQFYPLPLHWTVYYTTYIDLALIGKKKTKGRRVWPIFMVVCSENQLFYISSIEMSCFVHTWSCADVVVEIIIFEVRKGVFLFHFIYSSNATAFIFAFSRFLLWWWLGTWFCCLYEKN